jgi:uncharacterized protein
MNHLQSIDTSAIAPLTDPIAPERRITGAPMTGVRAGLERGEKGFYTGVWASEAGAWRIQYTEDELCVILAGRVRLTGDDGETAEYGPGDAFTIAAGFNGIWESLEPVRKIYAICT